MSLISTSIPNLIGGVSQQPPALRTPNQCERLENAVPSAFEGLIKRPPSEHVAVLKTSGTDIAFDSAYVHVIDRDATERYVVVFGRTNSGSTSYLKVYDINGTEKTVTTPSGLGYINEANIDTKLRAVTVSDVTFIVNRNKTVLASSTLSPNSRNTATVIPEALVWVKQTNYSRKYSIRITRNGITRTYMCITGATSTSQIGTDYVSGSLFGDKQNSDFNGVCTTTSGAVSTIVVPAGTHVGTLVAGMRILGDNFDIDTTVLSFTTSAGAHTITLSKPTIGATSGRLYAWKLDTAAVFGYNIANFSGVNVLTANNVTWVYGSTATDTFDILSFDDFGGEGVTLTHNGIGMFADLPDNAPHGYLIKITGNVLEATDDYWVRFVQTQTTPSTTTISDGYWKEDMAPGIPYKMDNSTMPHVLVRNSDGSFTFKPADGSTYTDFSWASRVCGDDYTAPMPAFIGQKISDLSFFKNRLVLLSGEYVSTSEISQYFNFFPTTVQRVLDSDPIEVGSTQSRVSDMKSSAVFSDRLVIFTPQTQLTLKGDGALTPNTVSLTASASYENTDTAPTTSGTSIFFPFNRGSYSGIREMFVSNGLDLQFDAVDLTVQVPQFISGSILKIVASTHDNYLVCLGSGDRSVLYVYKYYNQGDQRVQSAWGKFTFKNAYILDIQFIDTVLYIVMKRGNQSVVEKINMESGKKDLNSTYMTTIDRRVDGAACTVAYNSTTNLTTYTLPYTISSNEGTVVVSKTGQTLYMPSAASGTTAITQGNTSATPVWIGSLYNMVFQFSEPNLTSATQSGNAATILSGRYQLRYGTISFGNTSNFKVQVGITGGDTFNYYFTGRIIGETGNIIGSVALDSGKFRFPIYSRNSQVSITVSNDSPLPSNLLAAEYEALFTDRTLRR
jgi:hypothetical protein